MSGGLSWSWEVLGWFVGVISAWELSVFGDPNSTGGRFEYAAAVTIALVAVLVVWVDARRGGG